ncbi:MAG: hypothetical protein ACTS3R_05115 [Inquilinaceae bacterium]
MWNKRKKTPPANPARIVGTVSQTAVDRAREALKVQAAKGQIDGMLRRDDGTEAVADALKRMIRN